jgi:hypothetical protein
MDGGNVGNAGAIASLHEYSMWGKGSRGNLPTETPAAVTTKSPPLRLRSRINF